MGEVLWDAQARSSLLNSNQNSRVLISPTEFLCKGRIGNTGTGMQAKLLIISAVVEIIIGNLHLLVTLWAEIRAYSCTSV